VTLEAQGPRGILARICAENLAVYRESQARLQEDVSQEAQVAHDYRGRLVYELLQNADDALIGVASTQDRALFRLTDTALWVANTGRAFTELDVRGLCGLGASSKANSDGPRRASIGHKGLGFKSVLEITDAPEAYSKSVCFRLGREFAVGSIQALWTELDRGTVRGVPVMRFPASLTAEHPVWSELQSLGYHSAFRFPFHDQVTPDQRQALASQLLTLPMTSVLFLKHLEEVVIEIHTAEVTGDRAWLLERRRVTHQGLEPCGGLTDSGLFRVDLINRDGAGDRYWVARNADVAIGNHRDGLTGPAWDGVDISEVSVAVLDAPDPRVDALDRRFHVFLPTQEPSGCSLLINGAFTTDLSRQHVQSSTHEQNYNAHLIAEAARTFAARMLPHLLAQHGPAYVLRVLEQDHASAGDAAQRMQAALTAALTNKPLLPARGASLTLADTALPTPILRHNGRQFAALLRPDAKIGGRGFPDPEFCEGELAAICASYGAAALSPVDTLRFLAQEVEPTAARLIPELAGRFHIDPLLEICTALWEAADAGDRQQLEEAARWEAVFPTGEDQDGTVIRILLGNESAFYPPRSSAEDLPLRRLRFLAHAICWGTLGRTEQRSILEHRMRSWSALFDIKDFRFEEVMRASVLPGLTRSGVTDLELRQSNRTIEALATICRIAGKTTKPDQPLPMGRLGSDRAFFNLSRLQVPCRTEPGEEPPWAEAHQVYFGRDWVGQDSVEEVADAMAEAGHPITLRFLAPPSTFEAYSKAFGVHTDPIAATGERTSENDGEVDLDDDTDDVLETTAEDRWRNFFAWLGVSRGLRLVHFHDVDDSSTGWTNTKGLSQPGGWAFTALADIWPDFRTELEKHLANDARWNSTDHYVYQVHSLDRFDEVASVARLSGNQVPDKFLAHLVRNWTIYARHTQAHVALVAAGKVPSSRTAPPRATSEELATAGPDLWLYRLRRHPICPTSHGPRRPGQTWRRSEELMRRLGRSGRAADSYLPVLHTLADVPVNALRACLDELQVRGELTPAAFTVQDANEMCTRIAELYQEGVPDQVLRTELRPIYRQMFELLVGSTVTTGKPLSAAPLAAREAAGITFMPARDVVYASTSGSRERSGVQGRVPLFVLEAEPGALAPLRSLFGTPLLETALEWSVSPEEQALSDTGLSAFRSGLRELVPPLLARLSADRAERGPADRRALLNFVEKVEPVEGLSLSCSFRGNDLGAIPQRTYYVHRTDDPGSHAYITWTGPAWPPIAEDAQTLAMALAETLEVNTVETFLSFINANPAQRHQLLDLAGAAERLAEVEHDLLSDSTHQEAEPEQLAGPTIDTTDGSASESTTALPSGPPKSPSKAADRVPLHRYEDLLLDGEVVRLLGTGGAGEAGASGANLGDADDPDEADSTVAGPSPRAAAGTDLDELDRLGMLITMAFERRRFEGKIVSILPNGGEPDDADVLVVDVSSPKMIDAAAKQSRVVQAALDELRDQGISPLYPGFDILTISDGKIDRMIELKSSGVDAQVQAMSWNEWKTAQGILRSHFWLYLVGNLRADLPNTAPFVRAVHDPFGTLESATHEDTIRKRSIQLRVREFAAADQLTLTIRAIQPAKPE